MKGSVSWLSFALLSLLIAISAGCGGAGPSSSAGAAPAAVHEVTGVAATGAPIANVTVFLKDSSDTPVERQQSTRSDGSFTFDASGLKPPFILKIASNNQNLYSISTDFGMTNITPLTAIVVAQAAQRDDLDALYTAYKPAELISIAQRMSEADMTVQNIFAPLMTSYNVTGSLVNGQFSANHTGYDAMLDVISVSVVPGAITVTLKNDNSVLLNVAANQLGNAVLSSNGAPSTAPTVPAVGSALYTAKCAGCHGSLASSSKKGITIARLQTAIANNTGGMGYLTTLSASDVQALVTVLTPATPTPTPTPAIDGPTLYSSSCASCHGALASSNKAGATAGSIQTAINNNTGSMGSLSGLTSARIAAISAALATVPPSPAPAPAQACGSCHAIPPAAGRHSKHRSVGCASCHGSGYSTTSFNATTHKNGVKNIDIAKTGWNIARRSCSNACHGSETW
ncbi:MAG: c-type cytochrome [Verrucomicrobia bacterium]|nr:c-type cytochrome [Deltaproteobacteria bacterium]